VLSRSDEAAAGVVRAGGRLLPARAATPRRATPGRAAPAASAAGWRAPSAGGVFCGGGALGRPSAPVPPPTAATTPDGGGCRSGAAEVAARLRGFAFEETPGCKAAGRPRRTQAATAALLPPLEQGEARRRLQGHSTGNLVHEITFLSLIMFNLFFVMFTKLNQI